MDICSNWDYNCWVLSGQFLVAIHDDAICWILVKHLWLLYICKPKYKIKQIVQEWMKAVGCSISFETVCMVKAYFGFYSQSSMGVASPLVNCIMMSLGACKYILVGMKQ
ncbi:hypothetical protein I3842_01G188800 [Carya illinoinensis]|uniref:Uncharacterized protein n=1 Tax=Carya illinoinensis TaxID=32201 RepID=A0A922K586_CARIL|nr:hypothetical protein I3842_01G188800 [Carya illinoinensis]